MSKDKKRWWLKRLVLALLMPFGLFILAGLIFSALGTDVSSKLTDVLSSVWLPLTFFRLCIYSSLAYWFIPVFLSRQRDLCSAEAQFLQQFLNANHSQGDEALEAQCAYDDAVKKQRAYEQLRQQRGYILLLFVVFDLITIQLPFWTR